jgi:hypothetical protein
MKDVAIPALERLLKAQYGDPLTPALLRLDSDFDPLRGDPRFEEIVALLAPNKMQYWEIIVDNLSKAGWSWGCVSAVDCNGRTIWIVDAHRGDGKRFVVRADEKLMAFLELEAAINHSKSRTGKRRIL